jgi:cytochrome c oxidase subunit 2
MVDWGYYFILYLSAFFFAGIIGATVWFCIKYRKRSDNDRTGDFRHSTQLEIWWSVLPSILLLWMFWWGAVGYMELVIPPDNGEEIRVTARQWSWQFDYPRDGIVTDDLVVPVDTPIRLTMTATDVLHSFYVPEFRIKKDIVPGRYTVAWFEATEIGTYNILCAEYCGKDHSRMLGRVQVLSREDYDAWIDSGGGIEFPTAGECDPEGQCPEGYQCEAESNECRSEDYQPKMAEIGEIFFQRYGCNQCHNVDGTANTGPNLDGKYGTAEALTNGTTVDPNDWDNYIRESILYPNAKVVVGFQPKMPSFQGKIQDQHIVAIIEYMKSL